MHFGFCALIMLISIWYHNYDRILLSIPEDKEKGFGEMEAT